MRRRARFSSARALIAGRRALRHLEDDLFRPGAGVDQRPRERVAEAGIVEQTRADIEREREAAAAASQLAAAILRSAWRGSSVIARASGRSPTRRPGNDPAASGSICGRHQRTSASAPQGRPVRRSIFG